MNMKPSVAVVAALLLVNACGPRIGVPGTSGGEVVESTAPANHVGEASVSGDEATHGTDLPVAATTTQAGAEGSPSAEGESVGNVETMPGRSTTQSVVATTATTTAPVASGVPATTTTTRPPVDVDLDALNQALDELDALLGLFDSQIDAVDLDETEGETP